MECSVNSLSLSKPCIAYLKPNMKGSKSSLYVKVVKKTKLAC